MSKGSNSQFSLKPVHSDDPHGSAQFPPIFSRKDSKNEFQDDSLLPTSALPYIYSYENDMQSSPPRSHVSTSILPPLDTEKENHNNESQSRSSSRDRKQAQARPIPSASDMMREVVITDEAKANWEAFKKATTQNKSNESDSKNYNSSPTHTHTHTHTHTNREIAVAIAALTSTRKSTLNGFSVRITTSQSRIDPVGKPFTSYVMTVETKDGKYSLEHRYSDFSDLQKDLKVNGIKLKSRFPMKSLAGRIGDWTPAQRLAPETHREMIRNREKMLDVWMIELVQIFEESNNIHGELRTRVKHFLQKSSTAVAPCDKPNHISWDGFLDSKDGDVEFEGQMRREGGMQKMVGNPLSFSLESSIRQAAYTVMHMCGNKNTLTLGNGDQTDQSIPLDLLQNARGLVFLTVVKGGLVMSVRGGTGLLIARRDDESWTPPVALGTVGIGWGALIGGGITNYMIVLNTERAVKVFAQKRSVNLGAELGVAVGPVGRAAGGNVNAGTAAMPAPAYAYAHSKGLFVGISFEGSISEFVLLMFACLAFFSLSKALPCCLLQEFQS